MAHNHPPKTVDYEKPVPRDPKSPSRAAQVRVQNRRREYLQRHPSYFDSLDHELADPVLYQRLVRDFQSASERTAEGQAKGYGRTLEASLLRGERTLAGLASGNEESASSLSPPHATRSNGDADAPTTTSITPSPGPENSWDAPMSDKQEGLDQWRAFLEDRFVRGGDDEFDYAPVDADEELDVWERGQGEERWFDEEEPGWVGEGGDAEDGIGERKGETGVQDY